MEELRQQRSPIDYFPEEFRAQLKLQRDELERQVTNAVIGVLDKWEATNYRFRKLLHVGSTTVPKIRRKEMNISIVNPSYYRATVLIEIDKNLTSYLGGDTENQLSWLNTYNTALTGIPIELMATDTGLRFVQGYVAYFKHNY